MVFQTNPVDLAPIDGIIQNRAFFAHLKRGSDETIDHQELTEGTFTGQHGRPGEQIVHWLDLVAQCAYRSIAPWPQRRMSPNLAVFPTPPAKIDA